MPKSRKSWFGSYDSSEIIVYKHYDNRVWKQVEHDIWSKKQKDHILKHRENQMLPLVIHFIQQDHKLISLTKQGH